MTSQTPCKRCPLRDTGAFSANTEAEIDFIQQMKKRQIKVNAGGAILREGDDRKELYTLLSGWAFRYRSLSDGRRQIFNFLLPGDFVGLQHQLGQSHPHGVEALTEATLCVFPSERLWDLYRTHPALGFDITWLSANEELIVDENLLSVGRRSAAERIAMLLIHLYKRAERVGLVGPDGLRLPLTQQHIADALGLSLVHTNKTLKRLQAAGLYTLNEGRLKLVNPAAMARLADYYALPLRARPLI
ncbi:MAG TPA: Crp/Fnr family transcriptional regulator [Thiobacillus sp.]|nr:MAG: Crp/Fnr family transcriptional regulator [Hydrogenophilales bacterium 16-64-40]OZA34915.1 MAG: Crp/Fnr family transcriptional regulator [Hydrogenophilales bacterium 17-64-65]HQS80983.1 Crp/Fnr family transcriptional regulator [Thiobacillus sp.]HQT34480.1 Crp/Fnr family transcriptional regulator [Thiobacillus sp.]